jgi:glycosyltransferase involved in cell wall biosynthesis
MTESRSVGLVTDWLTADGGAPRVVQSLRGALPGSRVYTLVFDRDVFRGTNLDTDDISTSFIQRLPGVRRYYRATLPLMPLAVETLDLRAHDLIISVSHAVAKGVLTRSDQLHVSYVCTPVRYGWDLSESYLEDGRWNRGIRAAVAHPLLHYLRLWDLASACRPDVMVAISRYAADRIRKTYGRRAPVIYPPVDVDRFTPHRQRDDFYVTVSRLVPYKKIDVLAAAFTRMQRPLVIIGDGPERKRIARLAGPTVRLLGWQDDSTVADFLERCRAFLFAADEDFGISPVEALAAGAPVIAYGRGGITETVEPGVTGVFFDRQTVDGVIEAVHAFERRRTEFSTERIALSAARFGRARFHRELDALIERAQQRRRRRRGFALETPPVALQQ